MKMKIDQTPPQRNRIPWRTMLGAVLICVLSSLYSFGQSAGYTSLLEAQKRLQEYQTMYVNLDVSTPEGAETKLQLEAKIAELQIVTTHYYGGLSMSEQMEFQSWVATENITAFPPTPSDVLIARMDQLGMPIPAIAATSTTPAAGSTTSSGYPTSGPIITTP